MKENFDLLKVRVISSLENSNIERINEELSKIEGPTLVSGVGGANVVSSYASKVLASKNHIITRNTEPRDFRYIDYNLYKNVLVCSYTARNYGVTYAFLNDLKHYLLSSKTRDNVANITYSCLDHENSFIALSAILVPCSILLNYYLDNDTNRIIDSIKDYSFDFDVNCNAFEVFSGYETSTSSSFIDSCFVESGIGIPIIHDKYSYCHGRSSLSTHYNNIAIFFNGGTELDKVYLDNLYKCYKDVIVLDFEPTLLGEFELLVKCMYLSKYIAEKKDIDLSHVKYSPMVKKLYYYKGEF